MNIQNKYKTGDMRRKQNQGIESTKKAKGGLRNFQELGEKNKQKSNNNLPKIGPGTQTKYSNSYSRVNQNFPRSNNNTNTKSFFRNNKSSSLIAHSSYSENSPKFEKVSSIYNKNRNNKIYGGNNIVTKNKQSNFPLINNVDGGLNQHNDDFIQKKSSSVLFHHQVLSKDNKSDYLKKEIIDFSNDLDKKYKFGYEYIKYDNYCNDSKVKVGTHDIIDSRQVLNDPKDYEGKEKTSKNINENYDKKNNKRIRDDEKINIEKEKKEEKVKDNLNKNEKEKEKDIEKDKEKDKQKDKEKERESIHKSYLDSLTKDKEEKDSYPETFSFGKEAYKYKYSSSSSNKDQCAKKQENKDPQQLDFNITKETSPDKSTNANTDSVSNYSIKTLNIENSKYITLSSDSDTLYTSICTNKKGLRNLGNTCFMNTCLQNLIHCGPFIKRLISIKEEVNSNTPRNKRLSQEFLSLCRSQSSSSTSSYSQSSYSYSLSPDSFKEEFSHKHHEYIGYRQHDTQEFCRLLLEDISKELNTVIHIPPYKELDDKGKTKEQLNIDFDNLFRRRENSIIIDTFYGQFVNIFTCKCGFKSFSFEKFLDIPILLDYGSTEQNLNELLNKNFENDSIEWGAKCEKCGMKTVHSKEIKLAYLPEILILSLQRSSGRSYRKNNAPVKFTDRLNLEKFVDKECIGNVNYRYSLVGISNHCGSLDFGHYFSYNKLGDDWYEFNDSCVTRYSVSYCSSSAYVLFYQRDDTF